MEAFLVPCFERITLCALLKVVHRGLRTEAGEHIKNCGMMATWTKVLAYILQGEVTRFNNVLAMELWESK